MSKVFTYLDRDISEMSFNRRVLDQVNRDIPIAEKLFFIGVTFSNLAEYCMSRYPRKLDILKDDEAIKTDLKNAIVDVYETASSIFAEQNMKHTFMRPLDSIDKKKMSRLNDYFKKEIYPALQPKIITDSAHLEPRSNDLCIFVETESDDKDIVYHNIIVPAMLGRFIRVKKDPNTYFIEDIIKSNLNHIFKGYRVKRCVAYTIQRSFNLVFDEDSDDMEMIVRKSLKKINRAWITRLEIEESADKSIIKVLKNHLNIAKDTIIVKENHVRLSDLKDFPAEVFDEIERMRKFKRYNPFPKSVSIFETVSEKDRLVIHPYESFDDSVLRFLKESARDPDVVSIKMTIYRVAKNSKVIKYLLDAAENGKAVTVMVELKARFNEIDNLNVATIMKEYGIDIIYSDEYIKTHAKVCLVTRKESGKMRIYTHLGTGNYSEVNSKSYTDYSYFTKNSVIGEELTQFFNTITGSSKKLSAKSFLYAPKTLRGSVVDLIKDEIKKAEQGKSARIIMKCNALTDLEIADWLYKASAAGVKVTLYVRGACIIRPGVKKLSKNIEIFSIIGQYLEHSRVYVFGKNADKVLIGSSDMMSRNLSTRNELLLYITDKDSKARILNHLKYLSKDTINRYRIMDNYEYERVDGDPYDVHQRITREAKKRKGA